LGLKLAHLFDFVEVHNKALLVRVLNLNALSAEDSLVVRAVKVHNALTMRHTKFVLADAILTLNIIEVYLAKEVIAFHYLIQNVDVQW